jgi:methionine-rich copper-binding protein CopC
MAGCFQLIQRIRLALAALLLSAVSAFPHASPIRTSPPTGGTVQNAPREVSVLFGERVEVSADAIVVQDASGTRVDQGDAHLDYNGRIVRTALRPISAGVYTVGWRVRSADGHTAQGRFTFRVQK